MADADHVREESDAELARRFKSGDREVEVEAELYRRFAPRIRLYGLRHLRDPAAAEDLAQDVVLMTFESLREGKVREPERLASYILGTCRRVVAGWRRGVARRERLLDRFGTGLPATVAADEPLLDLDRVARCLSDLTERERSVVVLSFYAERPSPEIAAELGLSPANVRVVRHRALARMRTCLEGAR